MCSLFLLIVIGTTSITLSAADSFFQTGNYAEAVLWMIVAAVFAVYAIRTRGAARRRCLIAILLFLFFGLSDVVEVQTGAWWRPWWLFAWKAACVAGMLWLLWDYFRRQCVIEPPSRQECQGCQEEME